MTALRGMVAVGLAVALGGCGGDPNEAWYGTWNVTGTQTTDCGMGTSEDPLDDQVPIVAGFDEGTIETTTDGCTIAWDVDGDRARIQAGQSCIMTDGSNTEVSFTSGEVTLSGDVITGTMAGTSDDCTFTQELTMTRVPE